MEAVITKEQTKEQTKGRKTDNPQIIFNFRKEYPDATKKDAQEMLTLSQMTVARYWGWTPELPKTNLKAKAKIKEIPSITEILSTEPIKEVVLNENQTLSMLSNELIIALERVAELRKQIAQII